MSLKMLKPRHREIMRRLLLGEMATDVGREMGISDAALSVMINSPLFQLELRTLQKSAEGKAIQIQNVIFDTALEGANLHLKIVKDELILKDGTKVEIDVHTRQRSATDGLVLAAKLMRAGEDNGAIGALKKTLTGDLPYERRLREVTFRESTEKGGVDGRGVRALSSSATDQDDNPYTETDLDELLQAEEKEGLDNPYLPQDPHLDELKQLMTAEG